MSEAENGRLRGEDPCRCSCHQAAGMRALGASQAQRPGRIRRLCARVQRCGGGGAAMGTIRRTDSVSATSHGHGRSCSRRGIARHCGHRSRARQRAALKARSRLPTFSVRYSSLVWVPITILGESLANIAAVRAESSSERRGLRRGR
ncbi:hypothetical protein FA09DRAFT_40469 [Tilletiopsis washingtonensis]|uniref:Uncharacterized protein n=1 Tax=Tilletiopsis washingtonensis TaxID=58919 RepID=A0A316ZBL4_9BASI|nr:hypothetical protein FA09DRAFT_40469 [Tilletiopsis washingtonensis]PWN97593.1 hypothetical protein FA09DRAFT_40469 [Tilletiopsis washingtonensis]